MDEVIILDFETTGLSPSYARIIEVAAILVKNKKIVDKMQKLTRHKNIHLRLMPPERGQVLGDAAALAEALRVKALRYDSVHEELRGAQSPASYSLRSRD